MKAAIIENGIVTNIAKVADETFAESQGWIVSDTAKIGGSYDATTGTFTAPPSPPKPVPRSITSRQGEQQLIIDGLDEQVQAAIDGITDVTERKLTQAWYLRASTWDRDNAELLRLATALGLTEAQIDTMFLNAAKL